MSKKQIKFRYHLADWVSSNGRNWTRSDGEKITAEQQQEIATAFKALEKDVEGVKLIKHTGECDHPDEPSLPFKLYLVLKAPEFMIVAWVCLYGGSEEVVARGRTPEALSAWADKHELKTHTRFLRYAITNNDGAVVESEERRRLH